MKAALKICVLGGIVAAAAAWAAFAPPLLQSQDYHRFADARALLAVENAADTLSNFAFLLVGAMAAFLAGGAGLVATVRGAAGEVASTGCSSGASP
jgi:hypothetical protein